MDIYPPPELHTLIESTIAAFYESGRTFKTTYLYIKQHSTTGKLYFGKTIRNPEKYLGSGDHWMNHFKKHGKEHVVTLWYCLFLDVESLVEFALKMSERMDIVKSKEWLNNQLENGLDGFGSPGRIASAEQKKKISAANKGRKHSPEVNKRKASHGSDNGMFGVHRFGESAPRYGIPLSESGRTKISEHQKSAPKLLCPHCNRYFNRLNADKHHFDNCKLNPDFDIEAYNTRKMSGRVCRLTDQKELDCGNWALYKINQTLEANHC